MSDSASAIWSAIAATFSAIAALLLLRFEKKNLLDSSRPEIILSGWERGQDPKNPNIDVLTFSNVQNAGKGSALHVHIDAFKEHNNKPQYLLHSRTIPILPVGGENPYNGKILIFWDNVEIKDKTAEYIHIEISILSWCTNNYRHKTTYYLMATRLVTSTDKIVMAGVDEIVPGIALSRRITKSEPVWRLRLMSKLKKLPFINKIIKKLIERFI